MAAQPPLAVVSRQPPLGVPKPVGAAGGKSSRARGSKDPLPERPVPSAVAADLGVSPSGGQGQSQWMSELLASILVMAPWRLKAVRLKPTSSAHPEPTPMDMETDAGDKSNPKRLPKSYTAVAKNGRAQSLPHLLCIHQGTEESLFIDENLFSRVKDAIEKIILADQSEDDPIVQCSFKRWAGGKGLLSCLDKETADYISQIVSMVKIDSKTFRAWPRGEYGKLEGSLSLYLFKITC